MKTNNKINLAILLLSIISLVEVQCQIKVFSNGNVGVKMIDNLPYSNFHVKGNSVFTETPNGIESAAFIRGRNAYSTETTPNYTWYNNDQTGLFHPEPNVIGFTSSGSEKMRIHSNGNVGIGITDPASKFHVYEINTKNTGQHFHFHAANGSGSNNNADVFKIEHGRGDGFPYALFKINNASGIKFYVKGNGYVGIGKSNPAKKLDVAGYVVAINGLLTSDKLLKKDIDPIKESLSIINQIDGISFTYNDLALKKMGASNDSTNEQTQYNDNNRTHFGFVAQDVQKVLPDLVHTDNEGYLSIEYNSFIPLLLEAIKEQQAQIEELSKKIKEKEDLKRGPEIASHNLQDMVYNRNLSILYQNEPNPFTDNTEIKFYLPADINEAIINIYNMQGLQLKSYPIAERGNSSIQINGYELQAGIYLYSLIADRNEIDLKRMVLTD